MKKLQFILFALSYMSNTAYAITAATDSLTVVEEYYLETLDAPQSNTKWNKDWYTIDGTPYTGKVYYPLFDALIELRIKDGKTVQKQQCRKKLCQVSYYGVTEGIISETDEDGNFKDGLVKKEAKQLENGITDLGYEGIFNKGIPDGLHKTFGENNSLESEIMYDKGRKVWEKEYTQFDGKTERTEKYYSTTGVILSRMYKEEQINIEKKYLYSGEPIQLKKYLNKKLLYTIDYNKDRSATLTTYNTQEKHFLKNNRQYKICYNNTCEKFPEWLEGLISYPTSKSIVYGNRTICSIPVPPEKYIKTNHKGDLHPYFEAGCYKNFKSNKTWAPDIKLTEQQIEEIYINPKTFFTKNEGGIDLSDLGNIDISQYQLNLDKMKKTLEDIGQGFQEILTQNI